MSPWKYTAWIFLPTLCLLFFLFIRRARVLGNFSRVESRSVGGGWQAAKMILDSFHLFDIGISEGRDDEPSLYRLDQKVIRLNPWDYESHSLTAVGRALHEAGHALQHMGGNGMLMIKTYFWPWIRMAGCLSVILIPASLIPFLAFLYPVAAFLFTLYVVFAFLITPMEWNASQRVYNRLAAAHLLPQEELSLLEKVLEVFSLEHFLGLFEFSRKRKKIHVP